jgi:hypothetical protein
MVFRTRKAASIAGMLLVAIGWLTKGPMLVESTSEGLISVISFLLLFAATVSLLIGALKVQLGKGGRRAFILHIAFAALALASLHFRFAVPLALGIVVACTEVFWPVQPHANTVPDAGAV